MDRVILEVLSAAYSVETMSETNRDHSDGRIPNVTLYRNQITSKSANGPSTIENARTTVSSESKRTFAIHSEQHGSPRLMSEDEVSSLVHNALRRARQATSASGGGPRRRTRRNFPVVRRQTAASTMALAHKSNPSPNGDNKYVNTQVNADSASSRGLLSGQTNPGMPATNRQAPPTSPAKSINSAGSFTGSQRRFLRNDTLSPTSPRGSVGLSPRSHASSSSSPGQYARIQNTSSPKVAEVVARFNSVTQPSSMSRASKPVYSSSSPANNALNLPSLSKEDNASRYEIESKSSKSGKEYGSKVASIVAELSKGSASPVSNASPRESFGDSFDKNDDHSRNGRSVSPRGSHLSKKSIDSESKDDLILTTSDTLLDEALGIGSVEKFDVHNLSMQTTDSNADGDDLGEGYDNSLVAPTLSSVNSSDAIIRRVEEEIANARKAAQDANRRLADVSSSWETRGKFPSVNMSHSAEASLLSHTPSGLVGTPKNSIGLGIGGAESFTLGSPAVPSALTNDTDIFDCDEAIHALLSVSDGGGVAAVGGDEGSYHSAMDVIGEEFGFEAKRSKSSEATEQEENLRIEVVYDGKEAIGEAKEAILDAKDAQPKMVSADASHSVSRTVDNTENLGVGSQDLDDQNVNPAIEDKEELDGAPSDGEPSELKDRKSSYVLVESDVLAIEKKDVIESFSNDNKGSPELATPSDRIEDDSVTTTPTSTPNLNRGGSGMDLGTDIEDTESNTESDSDESEASDIPDATGELENTEPHKILSDVNEKGDGVVVCCLSSPRQSSPSVTDKRTPDKASLKEHGIGTNLMMAEADVDAEVIIDNPVHAEGPELADQSSTDIADLIGLVSQDDTVESKHPTAEETKPSEAESQQRAPIKQGVAPLTSDDGRPTAIGIHDTASGRVVATQDITRNDEEKKEDPEERLILDGSIQKHSAGASTDEASAGQTDERNQNSDDDQEFFDATPISELDNGLAAQSQQSLSNGSAESDRQFIESMAFVPKPQLDRDEKANIEEMISKLAAHGLNSGAGVNSRSPTPKMTPRSPSPHMYVQNVPSSRFVPRSPSPEEYAKKALHVQNRREVRNRASGARAAIVGELDGTDQKSSIEQTQSKPASVPNDQDASKPNRSKKVRFRQRYPVPPLIAKPRAPLTIIKDNELGDPQYVLHLAKPKRDLKELLDAVMGSSLARRSNACGALKVLSTKPKNKLTLVRTAGFMDALVFAADQSIEPMEEEIAIDARTRAVNTILNIAEPKDNRVIVLSHPRLLQCLVKVIVEDSNEARASACGAIALLAKTPGCREPLVKTKKLVEVLATIVKGVEDSPSIGAGRKELSGDDGDDEASNQEFGKSSSSDSSSDSMSSMSSARSNSFEELPQVDSIRQKKIDQSDELAKRSRFNACAALIHLSKHCSVSVSHEVASCVCSMCCSPKYSR